MKIYTAAKKRSDCIDVGVVLVNSENTICLASGFRVADNKEYEGHLMGIRRGLSYIKNVKPEYLVDDVHCIFSSEDRDWINLRIREDRYMRNLKKYLHINIDTKTPLDEDKKYLDFAHKCFELKTEFILDSYQR